MKTKLMAVSTILLMVLMIAGGTMAWFNSSTGTINNEFKMGTVDVVVVEEFPEEGYNKVTTIEPYTKNVRVQSLGSKKTYVRVRLVPQWSDPSLPVSNVQLTFAGDMGEYWYDNTKVDGYYYYKYYLTKEKPETSDLLASVKFTELGPEYDEATFTLKVVAEGVQITNNAYQDVWGLGDLPYNIVDPNPYTRPDTP